MKKLATVRAKREAPPPSKWGKTRSGSYFRVILQRQRGTSGKKLYRLLFLADGVKGTQLWTLDGLNAAKVRWLKNKPRV